jgi:hypothetical protein
MFNVTKDKTSGPVVKYSRMIHILLNQEDEFAFCVSTTVVYLKNT